MALKTLPGLQGVFDTDQAKLVGVCPEGTNDVSYFPTSPTPYDAAQVPASVGSASQNMALQSMVSGYGIPARVSALRAAAALLSENAGTVTNNGTSSALNANTGGTVSYPASSPLFRWNTSVAFDASNRAYGASLHDTTGSINENNTPIICAFDIDETEVEFVLRGTQSARFTAWVHDRAAGTTIFPRASYAVLPNSGTAQYVKFSLGSNTDYMTMPIVTKSAGGSGYAVGDTITLAGGTTAKPAVVKVVQVNAGAVSIVDVLDAGEYTALPTSPASQASTSGAGTGATFTWNTGGKRSGKRTRTWFFCFHGASLRFNGVNVASGAYIRPATGTLPIKLVCIGDSQTNGTFLERPAGHWGLSVAQRLGLICAMPAVNAIGGTGYLKASGSNGAWSHPSRIADFIAEAGDIYFWAGSQNDDSTTSALSDAVVSTISAVADALPFSCHIVLPSVLNNGNQATQTALYQAAWATLKSKYGKRFASIDAVMLGWFGGSGKVNAKTADGLNDFYLASDGAHYSQDGIDRYADLVAMSVMALVSS